MGFCALHGFSASEAKNQTKPPSRFTPSTLLQAMKEIAKFVKNEDLKKQLKAVSGIGTEATRANIIDELISRGFYENISVRSKFYHLRKRATF